jgi:hypothetical protein
VCHVLWAWTMAAGSGVAPPAKAQKLQGTSVMLLVQLVGCGRLILGSALGPRCEEDAR